ncbi:Omp28 family outer membrane lipoprotein [Aurantibacillus circumpalustris]|uniref:Omp28 family outer membrane lipoprotein n=1 Tax=Aurantibacillus circumpalustris TaxID=3036359 RepID=UPI00295B24D0|nr:Omp28 family outer membrane lipoprotein [Aurantibacillus circumpalustris]
MKKLIAYSIIAISIIVASCDKIKVAPQNTTAKPNTRKILLEDYTGHQCGNCPAAAGVAENLSEKYGDKLIVIAVHAGFFTKLNSTYVTSYTCEAGNDWDASTGFGISGGAGNPNGMINRKNYADNGRIQKETKWSTSVSLASNDIEFCDLTLNANYDAVNRKLNTTVKTKFRRHYDNKTKISVVLTEDSIIGPQKDYSKNPDLVPNYTFMHLLRGSINGSWGADLLSSAKYQDSVIVSYPNFSINPKFVDKNVSVVAFVYDDVTKEVLQVEKVKIR